MLALEVIWFRFILLFYTATSWTLAVMLAMVLLGISLEGLLASLQFRRHANAPKWLPYLLIANGMILSILYSNFSFIVNNVHRLPPLVQIFTASLFLIFPVCLLSGLAYVPAQDPEREKLTLAAYFTPSLQKSEGAKVKAARVPP